MNIGHILAHLGLERRHADLNFLNALTAAYARKVPWETASRIVRRAVTYNVEECPRWPDLFWNDAIQLGTGGTCFESNYAFFAVLRALGFDGYLTINNMSQTVGCHTAIVIYLDNQPHIVDTGLPIHAALPFMRQASTETQTALATYRVHPVGDNLYDVVRLPHPKPVAYTLVDAPVSDAVYRMATIRDYGHSGLFLDRLIISKIVSEQQCRFASSTVPYHLEYFHNGVREDVPMTNDPTNELHAQFNINVDILSAAFKNLTG